MKNTKIVTYHNLINQITFKNFQKRDYDFFMALCSQLRDQDTKKIILTFKEIKELINVNLKMYSFDHLRMYNIDHINTCCSRW